MPRNSLQDIVLDYLSMMYTVTCGGHHVISWANIAEGHATQMKGREQVFNDKLEWWQVIERLNSMMWTDFFGPSVGRCADEGPAFLTKCDRQSVLD